MKISRTIGAIGLGIALLLSSAACGSKPLKGDALCRSKSFEQLASTRGCADYLQRYSPVGGPDCDEEDFREHDTDCGFTDARSKKRAKAKASATPTPRVPVGVPPVGIASTPAPATSQPSVSLTKKPSSGSTKKPKPTKTKKR